MMRRAASVVSAHEEHTSYFTTRIVAIPITLLWRRVEAASTSSWRVRIAATLCSSSEGTDSCRMLGSEMSSSSEDGRDDATTHPRTVPWVRAGYNPDSTRRTQALVQSGEGC